MRIIYNHKEGSGREENNKTKGCLNYNKEDRSFSCDASDMHCMGAGNFGQEFEVQVEETGNIKTFVLEFAKTDDEGELQYHLYNSKDGKHRFFIWND
jgi:hypothetical protein